MKGLRHYACHPEAASAAEGIYAFLKAKADA
jgi:hypothetical protein